jgi:putative chitinase
MGGFIQLTGRANYQAFSDYIKDDKVMEGVDYVAAHYPFSSAGWFWNNNKISEYINDEGADIYAVTKIVNGGYTNMKDRIFYFEKAKKIFNLPD